MERQKNAAYPEIICALFNKAGPSTGPENTRFPAKPTRALHGGNTGGFNHYRGVIFGGHPRHSIGSIQSISQ